MNTLLKNGLFRRFISILLLILIWEITSKIIKEVEDAGGFSLNDGFTIYNPNIIESTINKSNCIWCPKNVQEDYYKSMTTSLNISNDRKLLTKIRICWNKFYG